MRRPHPHGRHLHNGHEIDPVPLAANSSLVDMMNEQDAGLEEGGGGPLLGVGAHGTA